jgi:hypothetical protein
MVITILGIGQIMYGLMIHKHGRGKMTSKELWEREQRQVYREFLKEYLAEGYDIGEAKSLAKQDTKEVMEDKLDFVEDLYDNTLDDLD